MTVQDPGPPGQSAPPRELEEAPCPLCQGTERRPVLRADDWDFGLGKDFQIVRCEACSFHYTCPRPTRETIGSFYPEVYWSDPDVEADSAWFTRGMGRLLDSAAHRGLKVLDVGCGEGLFLAEASKRGWVATGVEPGRAAVELGREAGRQIQHGTLEDVEAPPGTYDAITLLDVLEHLHDPVAALRRCAELLAPGGYVVVRLPNFASWERVLFGRYWGGLQLPTHLHHFTPRDLRRAARMAGLSVVHEEGVPISFFVSSLHQALRAWRGDAGPSHPRAHPPSAESAPGPASAGTPGQPERRLNWKGRLLWGGIRVMERLARLLPRLHAAVLVGPIVCSYFTRGDASWPPGAGQPGGR